MLIRRKFRGALTLVIAVAAVALITGLIMPASARGHVANESRPGDIVIAVILVIDVSGSMGEHWVDGVKIESARTAAHELLELLKTEDQVPGRHYLVGLVEFNGTTSLLQSPTSDFNLLGTHVDAMAPGGYTNIGAGLEQAMKELDQVSFDRAYIVLLSDGVTNRGRSPSQILDWLVQDTPAGSGELHQASVYGADRPERAERAAGKLGEAGFYVKAFLDHDGKSTALSRLPADSVFSFNGHANWNVLGFNTRGWFGRVHPDRLTINHLSALDLSNLAVAVLAGCKTAKPVDGHDNIASAFVDRGTGVAIGFADWTNNHALLPWLDGFWHALIDEGRPVAVAFDTANLSYTFLEYEHAGRTYKLVPRRYQASVTADLISVEDIMRPVDLITDPRIDRAVSRALSLHGKTCSVGDDNTTPDTCLVFVHQVFADTGAVLPPLKTVAEAARILSADRNRSSPPRGAWVFYASGPDGHVALSTGDGEVIHCFTDVNTGVARVRIDQFDQVPAATYIGWAWPELEPPIGDVRAQDRSPRVFSVGFGDPGDLDEPLLRAIAGVTGGQYFYGGDKFSLANTFVKTGQLGTGSILTEFHGAVRPGERLTAGGFTVGTGESELRVVLNWPGSKVGLLLTDPRGNTVNAGYRGVMVFREERPAYIILDTPVAGEWTIEVLGTDVPARGSPFYVVASTSDVIPYRGDTLQFLVILSGVVALALIFAPRLLPAASQQGVDQL